MSETLLLRQPPHSPSLSP